MNREMKLCDLELNHKAVVKEIQPNNMLAQRIMNLGLSEGCCVTALYRSPFNDPTAYRVKGCIIALRKSDCENISVISD